MQGVRRAGAGSNRVRAADMASPLSKPEQFRCFDEAGGAAAHCEHSSGKQRIASVSRERKVEMYGTLHLPARLVPRHVDVASASEFRSPSSCRTGARRCRFRSLPEHLSSFRDDARRIAERAHEP